MKSRPSSVRPLRCAIAVMIAAILVATASFLGDPSARAAVPGGFTDSVVTSISQPTDIAFTPSGSMLVTSQSGRLYKRSGDSTVQVLNISAKICANFERGLLGVVVDPAFASNSYIYLYYTYNKHGTCVYNSQFSPVNRVSRFTFVGTTVSNEAVLVDNIPSPGGNHNAGGLAFGKDGYLYIAVGDGGCEIGSPSECGGSNDNARVKHRPLGKILRVNRNGVAPSSNPFYDEGNTCRSDGLAPSGVHCRETFAWGFRNPFRIAQDPNSASTKIYANDVGQNLWEEIDHVKSGLDYEWNICEGTHTNGSFNACPNIGQGPIFEYQHGSCNSLSGGAFVPNGVWPSAYDGAYFFADYTCGRIWTLKGGVRSDFASGLGAVTELEFGPHDNNIALYYANYGAGQIRRISYNDADNQPPVADIDASPTFGELPLTVAFDGRGSSDPDGDDLTYQWDFGDGSSSTRSTFNKTYKYEDKYRVTLTVSDGKGGTDTDSVTISAGNTRPSAEITSPGESLEFAVGETITLTGVGTDTEDGNLPDSSMTWEVLLHHDTHTHPFFGPAKGNDLTFQAPAPEDLLAAGNSYLEIRLTVRDSGGLGKLVRMDLMPNKVNVTVGSDEPGMMVWIESQPFTLPATILTWENNPIRLEAPDQVGPDNQAYVYRRWSDGGRRTHNYDPPDIDSSVDVTFDLLGGDTFPAHADARISELYPDRNEGGGTGLSAKGGTSSDYETVIRFKVEGIGEDVSRARLYLYAYDGTVNGPVIYESSPSWRELGVTWNNKPSPQGSSIDNYGAIAKRSWIAYDVADAIDGNGYVSFVIRGQSSDAVSWYSRHAPDKQPRLVIVSSGPIAAEGPDPFATETPEATATPEITETLSPEPTVTETIAASPEPSPVAESPTPEPTVDAGSPEPTTEPVDLVPYADSFEGDLSGWSSEGASLVAGAGPDGSQALRLESASSAASPGTASYVQRPLSEQDASVHVAFNLHVSTLDANATRITTIAGMDGAAIASLYLLPDGALGVRIGEETSLVPAGSIDTATWNRIEMAISRSSAGVQVDVWLNGAHGGTATTVPGASGFGSILLGGWATDRTYDLLVDNVGIDTGCISGCPPAADAPAPTSTPGPVVQDPVAPDVGTPVGG